MFFSGTPYKFELSYKQAANYPVDLYFVMDLSQSMKDDKDKLAGLGDKIGKNAQKLCKFGIWILDLWI